jgi:hypothetical protein
MNSGNGIASPWAYRLRIVLVLLALTALVVLGGCGLRSHSSASGQPAQTTTGQQAGGQPTSSGQSTGSGSAAQQIQDADQQVQNAMQGVDNAQNDANNADNQSNPSNVVP